MAKSSKPSRASKSLIRCCVDRRPPPAQLGRFARLARKEDPSNGIIGVDTTPTPTGEPPPKLAAWTAKKWANGRTIKIAFMGGTAASRDFMKRAAAEVAKYAYLFFEFTTSLTESELRWSFNKEGGAYSYIGTDTLGIPKDKNTGNLGWDDFGTATHELLHACGMIHEHASPASGIPWNLPAVYKYYGGAPNYWDRQTIDNNVIKKYSQEEITQFTEYDSHSIMAYPIPKEHVTDPSFASGWNTELSVNDKRFLGEVYPFPTSPPDGGDGNGEPGKPGTPPTTGDKALVKKYTEDVMAAADALWYSLSAKTKRLASDLAKPK